MLTLKSLGNKLSKTSIGIVSSQGINFLFIPILSRLYSPVDYAVFGLYLALVGILSATATAKLHDAISTTDSKRNVGLLVGLCSKILCIFLMAVAIPVVVYIQYQFGMLLVGVLCVGSIAFVAISNIALQVLMRERRYGSYSFQIFLTIGLPPLLQAAFVGLGGLGLVVGSFASHATSAMLGFWTLKAVNPDLSFQFSKREFVILKRYSSFPLFSLPNLLIMLVRSKLLYFVLPMAAARNYLGLYTQADRLLSAPASLFAIAFRPIATEALGNPKTMVATLEKFLRIQWYFLTPILAGTMVFASEILVILLGRQWQEVAPIFKILAVPAFLMMTTSWLDRFFDFTSAHRKTFFIEIFYGIGGFGVLSIMAAIGLTAFELIIVYSCLLTAYYFTWTYRLVQTVGGTLLNLFKVLMITCLIFACSYWLFWSTRKTLLGH